MYKKYKSFFALLLAVVIIIAIQACGSMSHMTSSNVKIYHENMDRMINVTRHAIRNCGERLKVAEINRQDDRTNVTFIRRVAAGKGTVNSQEGNVALIKLDSVNAIKVQVDNPEYSYSTPTELRIDYPKKIFEELDKLLK